LLSPDVLPGVINAHGAAKPTPRMYIYSKVDKIAAPAKIKAYL
jgi:hypothetical protein